MNRAVGCNAWSGEFLGYGMNNRRLCWLTCLAFGLLGMLSQEWAAWTPFIAAGIVIVAMD
jgi:hypothetical protein